MFLKGAWELMGKTNNLSDVTKIALALHAMRIEYPIERDLY